MNLVMQPTPKKIEIPRVLEVTQSTFRHDVLQLVADAAICRMIEEGGGTRENLQPSDRKRIDSVYRALEAILLKGIAFSGYANHYGEMVRFAMASTSRPKMYIVGDDSCQCESQLHNGYCVHRTTRALFTDYFKIVRADEDRARKYAELGIEVIEQRRTTPIGAPPDPFAGVPSEVVNMMRELYGDRVLTIRPIRLGPSSLGT